MNNNREPNMDNLSDAELLRMVYLLSDLLKTMVRNHELDAHADHLHYTYHVLLKEMQKRFQLNKMFTTYRVDVNEGVLHGTRDGYRYLFGTTVQGPEDPELYTDIDDLWIDAIDDIDESDDEG